MGTCKWGRVQKRARPHCTTWSLMRGEDMNKIKIYTISTILIIIWIVSTIILSNPLRRSQNYIKNDILKITPIGTKMEDVINIIKDKRQWEIDYISYDHGYNRPGKPDPSDIALGRETIVGEKSIRVFVGEYTNVFTTSVTVFWGFDDNSRLIDVYVWKDTDSL